MFHGEQCGACVGVCLLFDSSRQPISAPLGIYSQLQLESSVVCHGAVYFRGMCISVWHLCEIWSARKCQRKCWCKFHDERVPSKQTIHSLVNKLRTTRLLIDKKQRQVLRAYWDDIGARLVHTPRKSLKRLTQETGVSKSSARMAIQIAEA
jgi:hypothetical protein